MRIAVVTLKKPVFPLPKLAEGADEGDQELWKDEIKLVGKRRTFLDEKIKTLHAIIWGQCANIMQQKIEAAENFDEIWSEGDGLALLEIIQSITYAFQLQKYTEQSLFESYKKFFNQVQGRATTVKEHLTNFNKRVNVIKSTGGSFSLDPGMLRYVLNGKKEEELDERQLAIVHQEVRDRTLGASFMMTSDRGHFGKLIDGIENDYNEGRDRWSASVADAYHRLTYYSNNPRLGQREVGGRRRDRFRERRRQQRQRKEGQNKEQGECHLSQMQEERSLC